MDPNSKKLTWSTTLPREFEKYRSLDNDGLRQTKEKTVSAGNGKKLDMNRWLLNPPPQEDFNKTIFPGQAPFTYAIFNQVPARPRTVKTDWGLDNRPFAGRGPGLAIRLREKHMNGRENPVHMIWEVEYRFNSGHDGNLAFVEFHEKLDTNGPLAYQWPI